MNEFEGTPVGAHRREIVLARLPVPYRIWKQLRVFEHGDMKEPGRALETFFEHARTAEVLNDAGTVRARAFNAIFCERCVVSGFDVVLRRKGRGNQCAVLRDL